MDDRVLMKNSSRVAIIIIFYFYYYSFNFFYKIGNPCLKTDRSIQFHATKRENMKEKLQNTVNNGRPHRDVCSPYICNFPSTSEWLIAERGGQFYQWEVDIIFGLAGDQ